MGMESDLAREYPGVASVALAYSGGLDSAVIGRLLSKSGFAVHPVVADIGQQSDFSRIKKNAKAMFCSCEYVDARQEMAGAIMRALKANFGSDGRMNPGGIARPVIARALAEAARKLSCQAIAHGSSGTGNDHITMENSLRVLAPDMRIIAPVRDLDLKRDFALQFAKKEGLSLNMGRAGKFSADECLWGRTIRQGTAVDASKPLPEEAYKWTQSPLNAPSKPERIELSFKNGIPVHCKAGAKAAQSPLAILQLLNSVGARHGVGRLDAMDDKMVGLKMREIYECPGMAILLSSHAEMESLTLSTRELEVKRQMDAAWGKCVHQGGYYSRLRRFLDAFMDESSRVVEGCVSLEVYKGSVRVVGRQSRRAL